MGEASHHGVVRSRRLGSAGKPKRLFMVGAVRLHLRSTDSRRNVHRVEHEAIAEARDVSPASRLLLASRNSFDQP